MKIGIDRLSFFIPNLYLDMTELAESRGDDPAKYHIGIGQDQMAVNRANEDIITLGANAASKIVTEKDREQIDMVIVGTESGIDHSKASAVIIHHLLKIQSFARSFEVKEACYGGTAALHMAKEYVKNHPERKVLVIASDIARYGLASGVFPVPGGPTRSAPFGSFAPIVVYFPGLCRKSTTSWSDSFASSCPATSRNVTPVSFCT